MRNNGGGTRPRSPLPWGRVARKMKNRAHSLPDGDQINFPRPEKSKRSLPGSRTTSPISSENGDFEDPTLRKSCSEEWTQIDVPAMQCRSISVPNLPEQHHPVCLINGMSVILARDVLTI